MMIALTICLLSAAVGSATAANVEVTTFGLTGDQGSIIMPAEMSDAGRAKAQSGLSDQLSDATQKCLSEGQCQIKEHVSCNVKKALADCENRKNHEFDQRLCSCACPATGAFSEASCKLRGPMHAWNEADCTCRCREKGDAVCKGQNAKMHMSPAPACQCVCPTMEKEQCAARSSNPNKWKYNDAKCECQCQLTAANCNQGQEFFPDQCKCECPPEQAEKCLGDGMVWDAESCECKCPPDKDGEFKQCLQKAAEAKSGLETNVAALSWRWMGPPTCACGCSATEAECGKHPNWCAKPKPDCGCTCKASAAQECATRKAVKNSQLEWQSFPECKCACPPNADKVCGQKANTAWDARNCACGCNPQAEQKCTSAAADQNAPFAGKFRWDAKQCSCECDLNENLCAQKNARFVFDKHKCQCTCDAAFSEKECTAKQQATAAARAKFSGAPSFVFDKATCACACDKSKLSDVCKDHRAVANTQTCSCECDKNEKEKCDPSKGMVWSESPKCECKCDAKLQDTCKAKNKEAVGYPDCKCKCPEALYKQCQAKMKYTKGLKWNEETCECGCIKEVKCEKDGQTGLLEKVWNPEECACTTLQSLFCPTNAHLGCDWLFQTLSSIDLKANELTQTQASHPTASVCKIWDTSTTSFGTRPGAPKSVQDILAKHWTKIEKSKQKDLLKKALGDHCHSACEARFNVASTFHETVFKNAAFGKGKREVVSFNSKSCHVVSRKDINDVQMFCDMKQKSLCKTWVEKMSKLKKYDLNDVPPAVFKKAMQTGWPKTLASSRRLI